MEYLNRDKLISEINRLSGSDLDFLFLIDFKGEMGIVAELCNLTKIGISCSIGGREIGKIVEQSMAPMNVESLPISFAAYKEGFDKVMEQINYGDTYLLNLTYPTLLSGDISLKDIYSKASAQYKFMLENKFIFYSPEPFIRINDEKIYSFPMKGTISLSEDSSESMLLASEKELYEHYTIVDLIRNDLSMVASDIEVEQFRYIDKLRTHKGDILQTSSRISGKLGSDWKGKLGNILMTLLPAGSVSGAPKIRSVEIIEATEICERGFYTGVMGVFEGGKIDSCVNIRYMEICDNGNYYYRSGGGITSLSKAEDEYNELITKVYVPII